MKLRKGKKIIFKDRVEIITKASNDQISGKIITDKNEYSTYFINSWLKMGFLKIE